MDFMKKAMVTSMRAGDEIVARLIINTSKKEILFVPNDTDHPEFLALNLGLDLKKLKQQSDLVRPFVGAVIKIEHGKVTHIIIGISGIETVFESRVKGNLHSKQQVNEARDLVLATLQAGKSLSAGFKLNMRYK